MKLIENTPETQEQLEGWYVDLAGLDVPVTAVQNYTYIVTDNDLTDWLNVRYPGQEEAFNEALGINTRLLQGTYLCDINDAVRRMKGKPTSWD